jgi:poly(3-hydroxybutyrate) depolymerase
MAFKRETKMLPENCAVLNIVTTSSPLLGINMLRNETLRRLVAFFFTTLSASFALAQPYGSAGVQTAVVKSATTAPYAYYEYLPDDYNHTSAQKFGLMIFLHGAGEKGNGASELSRVASGQWPTGFIANSGRKYPLIVLSPQCSDQVGAGPGHDDCGWWNQSRLVQFVNYAKARYNVDPRRIYATGLSMGGAGTVFTARGLPNDIAAILSICQAEGGAESLNAPLRQMPMWLVHAYDDGTVNWGESRFFLDGVMQSTVSVTSGFDYPPNGSTIPPTDQTALIDVTQTNPSVANHTWFDVGTSTDINHNFRQRFTVYRNGGHGVWGRVYNDANIMNWLFKQRLNETPQTCNLDVNAGGAFDMKDARATIAWMLGFRSATLETFAGFGGVNATAIDQFLTAQQSSGALDLDGDSAVNAMGDGLMLLRIALGFTDGAAITSNAINVNGTRGDWVAVRNHLVNNCKLTLP